MPELVVRYLLVKNLKQLLYTHTYIYVYKVCVVKLVRIITEESVFASTVKPGFCISEAAT